MDKSIMALADDILGGALSNPTKAPSALSNPHQEPELPELSDEMRDGMIQESVVDEKLGRELSKHAQTRSTETAPGIKKKQTDVRVSQSDSEKLSAKAKSKLQRHTNRKSARTDSDTSWAVERPQDHQRNSWKAQRDREAKHRASRGVKKTPGANPAPSTPDREMLLKKKREAEERRRRSQGVKRRETTAENVQLLLRARDIMKEMTSVGAVGVGPANGRFFRNQAAPMGKDNVPIGKSKESPKTNAPKMKPVKKKDDKKKKKKLKKESYEYFLDAVVNEAKGAN